MVANHTVRAQSHMETAVVILEMTIPAGFYCSSSGGHRHQKRASVMPCLAQAASATTSPWFGQEPSQALVVSPAGLVAPSRVAASSQGWSRPALLPLCLRGFAWEPGLCSPGELVLNPFQDKAFVMASPMPACKEGLPQ